MGQSSERPPGRPSDPFGDGRRMIDGAYRRADHFIDRSGHHVFRLLWFFLPETSIARNLKFQYIMASTFFSDAGRNALKYGALVAVVRSTGSTLDAALVGVASLLPPTVLGLYGGAVADALPKRAALAIVYSLQAALCVVVPIVYGTELRSVMFLVFAVNVLGQVSGPGELSIAPLVASDEQLASANSLLSLASNMGTVVGTALLAPILLRAINVTAVFAASAALLLLATMRILRLQTEQEAAPPRWRRPDLDVRPMIRWLADEPAVGTMVIVGVLAGTANVVLETLAPRYVQSVLGLDPADAVYVFAPSAIGLALALVMTPLLIRWLGERRSALGGFAVMTAALCLLGFVPYGVDAAIDPVNPVRFVSLVGLHPGAPLRTAGALAIPIGFGVAAVAMAVQTYVNRRVPLARQGRAFALQSTLKNGSAIAPLLGLGAAASVFGVNSVLIVSPLFLAALALGLVRLSERFGGHAPTTRLEVLSSFWQNEPGANETAK
jgi:MFS family permease